MNGFLKYFLPPPSHKRWFRHFSLLRNFGPCQKILRRSGECFTRQCTVNRKPSRKIFLRVSVYFPSPPPCPPSPLHCAERAGLTNRLLNRLYYNIIKVNRGRKRGREHESFPIFRDISSSATAISRKDLRPNLSMNTLKTLFALRNGRGGHRVRSVV